MLSYNVNFTEAICNPFYRFFSWVMGGGEFKNGIVDYAFVERLFLEVLLSHWALRTFLRGQSLPNVPLDSDI